MRTARQLPTPCAGGTRPELQACEQLCATGRWMETQPRSLRAKLARSATRHAGIMCTSNMRANSCHTARLWQQIPGVHCREAMPLHAFCYGSHAVHKQHAVYKRCTALYRTHIAIFKQNASGLWSKIHSTSTHVQLLYPTLFDRVLNRMWPRVELRPTSRCSNN